MIAAISSEDLVGLPDIAAGGRCFPPYKLVAVASLIPYARNARTHSEAQVAQIAASIAEFGFTNPILTDGTRGVIAGHGRLLAARMLGMAEVPTIELSHLTPAQKRAYILADNRLALSAGWDDDLLRIELGELRDDGFDLALTGFDIGEIEALFALDRGFTDPDEVPPKPEAPISLLGDIWVMGRHILACGDSTCPETVAMALRGASPHLMTTDPPYGVAYDPAWRNRAGVSATTRTGTVLNDDRADWREAWALFPGDVAYVWHGALHGTAVAESLTATGFAIRAQIVWAKDRLVLGRGHYHWQHEPCWYAVRGKGHWSGDRKQTTLWQIPTRAPEGGQNAATVHGTQKPVECMRRPIVNNSSRGQAVYEPFSGSGTTIIAAEMEGRCCHAIELCPAYVDVGVLRWQAFTGKQAVLQNDGRTFAEISHERGGSP
jgi:DNA modification methylase